MRGLESVKEAFGTLIPFGEGLIPYWDCAVPSPAMSAERERI